MCPLPILRFFSETSLQLCAHLPKHLLCVFCLALSNIQGHLSILFVTGVAMLCKASDVQCRTVHLS